MPPACLPLALVAAAVIAAGDTEPVSLAVDPGAFIDGAGLCDGGAVALLLARPPFALVAGPIGVDEDAAFDSADEER